MKLNSKVFWWTSSIVTGLGVIAWASFFERRMYKLRFERVPVLPANSSPLRVLHISDLHLAPWQADKIRWVRSLARLKPDLIVNTGDNFGHPKALDQIKEVFSVFQGVPGVFVNGSNDYFAPTPKNPFAYFGGPSRRLRKDQPLNTSKLIEYFTRHLGWMDLNNRSASLNLKGNELRFLGVDDPHHSYDRLERVLPLAINEKNTVLALTHAPYHRILDAFVAAGAQVIFAGHTHGGQVCLPGFGALVTNCDLPRFQARGLTSWTTGDKSAWLEVSAGLGTSIYAPFRLACRPEAVLLTLTD